MSAQKRRRKTQDPGEMEAPQKRRRYNPGQEPENNQPLETIRRRQRGHRKTEPTKKTDASSKSNLQDDTEEMGYSSNDNGSPNNREGQDGHDHGLSEANESAPNATEDKKGADDNEDIENAGKTSEKRGGGRRRRNVLKENSEGDVELLPQSHDEIWSLPKVTRQSTSSDAQNDLHKRTSDFLKDAKHFNEPLQALKPWIDSSSKQRQQQDTKYKELLKECTRLGNEFEKVVSDLRNQMEQLNQEKKKEEDKAKAELKAVRQQYEDQKKKNSSKDPVLTQENQSLKAKLKDQQQMIISLEADLKELKEQLQGCQEQTVQKHVGFEAQLSEEQAVHARELEIAAAKHQIEVNHLEMKCRDLETQINDFKEEVKRKARDEATQTAIVIGQLERENDALKEEIEYLRQANSKNTNMSEPMEMKRQNENASNDFQQNLDPNGTVDTPNSAMNSPCYGDVISLINAVQTRRSSMHVRSPLSLRSQHVLQVESHMETIKQELEKSKLDIVSYQYQLEEHKKETKTFQQLLQEAQMQRQTALEEQEILMQVIGLYEMMTATKIKCLDDKASQKATLASVNNAKNGANGQTNTSGDEHENGANAAMDARASSNSVPPPDNEAEHRAVRFECKTLNPQTNAMLTFVLSTYINFVDYTLIKAYNFHSLPEFLASEMSFYDSSAPLFVKELLDVFFGKNKIIPLDNDITRTFPSTMRPPKQMSFTDASNTAHSTTIPQETTK